MKRIIFESAPEFIALCFLAGLAYAVIQYYRTKHPWSATTNTVLFCLRFVSTFLISLLLLGPIVKQINNLLEKPVFVVLQDNSSSIKATTDSTTLKQFGNAIVETKNALKEKGFDVGMEDLGGEQLETLGSYTNTKSDINAAIKRIANRYEGKNIAGVVLLSDGLYNSGLSPLYSNHNFPIYTVGLGDTTERTDIGIKNISYNKIAYQGNKFPVRAEVQIKNLPSQSLTASLVKSGKVIEKQTKTVAGNQLVAFDFQPPADEKGIQKYDIEVETNPNEFNKRNNRTSVFVEIIEGKKKILLIAGAPHPDIKTLREVVEKNSNYQFLLLLPGVSDLPQNVLQPSNIDLAIFHQAPDLRGKTSAVFQSFVNSKTSLMLILGQQSDLNLISKQGMPVKFEAVPRDFDEVTPVSNPAFSSFSLGAEVNSLLAQYPPVSVHYGKIQIPQSSTSLIFQKVGNVATEKPLLSVDIKDSRKIAIMFGEGLWRWRLNEYDRTESTSAFDEVFGKLIQFLSTTDDKRKFKSYPLQQEFSETEPVIFESQVYNDIYEPIFGNEIQIDVTSSDGSKSEYTYVTSPGNVRYQIGGLKEGVYRFRSRTVLNGKTEEVRGEFAVVERQAELQNLTADFDLLRKVSAASGGKFYKVNQTGQLQADLASTNAKSLIHSEETYDSLINLKWVFFVLLVLVTAEWGLRKYHGSY